MAERRGALYDFAPCAPPSPTGSLPARPLSRALLNGAQAWPLRAAHPRCLPRRQVSAGRFRAARRQRRVRIMVNAPQAHTSARAGGARHTHSIAMGLAHTYVRGLG